MIDCQRIDRWLWHARLVKTRSQAAALVAAGHVRLNRIRIVKPSHPVRLGDIVTASLSGGIRVLRVEAFADRRGPATAAQALFAELTLPAPTEPAAGPPVAREPGAGRPTKRERRHLVAWKRSLPAPDD